MMALLKRFSQVRTPVHSPQAEVYSRMRGDAHAYQTLGALLFFCQMLLFVLQTGYDTAVQCTWQSILGLAVPAILLWFLWQKGSRGASSSLGKTALIGLFPCLLLDATLLLYALTGLMNFQIPSINFLASLVFVSLMSLLIAIFARRNGVAYGVCAILYLLLFLLALGLATLLPDAHISRLAPVLGKGLANTSLTALKGIGSIWGVSLLFLLPSLSLPTQEKKLYFAKPMGFSFLYLLFPVVLCALFALFLGLIRPWQPTEILTMGERLWHLFSFNPSVMLCEASMLLWLFLLPLCLVGTLMTGEKIMLHCFAHLPRFFCLLPILLPAFVLCLVFRENLLSALLPLLPYRALLSLISAVMMLISASREGHA